MPVLRKDPLKRSLTDSQVTDLLDEIENLTLWGMNKHNEYPQGSREDLYKRITAIRWLVAGARIR